MDIKKLLATVVTAGVIVTGTAGIASAATAPSTTAPSTTATHASAKAHGHRHLRHRLLRAGAKVAASTIGIDVKTLVEDVRAGQSVADVAKAHDVAPQKVVDAVVTAGNRKIDQAVANGKLSAERATKLKARLPQLVTRVVDRTRAAR